MFVTEQNKRHISLMASRRRVIALSFFVGYSLFAVEPSPAAFRLDELGRYLTRHGYGGAELVNTGLFYHLPIQYDGRPGHLVIDTGSPNTIVFRSSVRRFALAERRTATPVSGAFGPGPEHYGVSVINSFGAGNLLLKNVPVGIAPDMIAMNMFGQPNGLLGLSEMLKFGAILDLSHRVLYMRPSRPGSDMSAEIKSILERNGWQPVKIEFTRNHLRVPGEANDRPCHFLVDTGAVLTALDRRFATAARIPTRPTRATARGVGRSGGNVEVGTFGSLWIGNYQIKNASASVLEMDPRVLGRGTQSEVAGLLGLEYLALNSAIFDFVSGTLYLRPKASSKAKPVDMRSRHVQSRN
jgi:predicted aspartyl protease